MRNIKRNAKKAPSQWLNYKYWNEKLDQANNLVCGMTKLFSSFQSFTSAIDLFIDWVKSLRHLWL